MSFDDEYDEEYDDEYDDQEEPGQEDDDPFAGMLDSEIAQYFREQDGPDPEPNFEDDDGPEDDRPAGNVTGALAAAAAGGWELSDEPPF